MRTGLLALGSAIVLAGGLGAQQKPVWFQTINCVKVLPGKSAEYTEFVDTATKKLMQQAVDEGRIVSWSLLRSVIPAGEEARCDYMTVTLYENAPAEPLRREALENALRKAGVPMTAGEYIAKRASVSRLVATEMWQPQIRVGQPAKGNYLFLNYMQVKNFGDYAKFEGEVWRPLAEAFVKDGSQTAWIFSTSLLPGGTEVKYAALTADIYPNWEEAFRNRDLGKVFAQVHPGKNPEQTMNYVAELRNLAHRQLLYIEERVSKQ